MKAVFDSGPHSRVPAGYTEVQYLHLTSTAYIDTDQAVREQRDHIQIDLQFVGSVANVFIGYPAGDNASYMRTSNATPSTCQGRNSGSLYTVPTFRFDTSRHVIGIDGYSAKKVYADEYSVSIPSSNNNYSNNTYRVGGRRSSSYTAFNGYIYEVKYWRDGVLIRDIIPCRDDDNNPYAYDIVARTFRTIANSANASVGPDVII